MSVTISPLGHADLDDPNFHNGGAAALLALLGYSFEDGDMSGVEDPVLFTGRALIASALVEVATADAEGVPGFWEGRFFQGERSPGYLASGLSELVELGMRAQRLKVKVTWG